MAVAVVVLVQTVENMWRPGKRKRKEKLVALPSPHYSESLCSLCGNIIQPFRSRYPDMTSDLKEFEAHLLQGSRELPELKLWQLQGEGRDMGGLMGWS